MLMCVYYYETTRFKFSISIKVNSSICNLKSWYSAKPAIFAGNRSTSYHKYLHNADFTFNYQIFHDTKWEVPEFTLISMGYQND